MRFPCKKDEFMALIQVKYREQQDNRKYATKQMIEAKHDNGSRATLLSLKTLRIGRIVMQYKQ